MKKHLPSGADSMVYIVTGSLIGLVTLLLALAGGIRSLSLVPLIILYGIAGILAVIAFAGWLARPVQYEVRDDSITIRRSKPFSSITIGRSAIKAMRHIELQSLSPTATSIPWVFGYSGHFRNKEIGDFLMYATGTKEVVVIEADKRYVISPANPRRFMHDASGKK